MAEPNFEIDKNDTRLTDVKAEEKTVTNDLQSQYDKMEGNLNTHYEDAIQDIKDYEKTQTKLQNERTDFELKKIEQQRDQAKKDYLKEQSASYVDWQKQSNQYGADAEQKASMGMTGTGYSESSQVSMYNTYQNRVATARASFDQAKLNYDNLATEARLQNSSALAEIAYNALKEQTALSIEWVTQKNQLLSDLTNKKMQVAQNYWQRYQAVIDQMNTENSLAEQVRQFNANLAEEQRQFKILHGDGSSGGSGGSSGGSGSSGGKISKTNKSKSTAKAGSALGGIVAGGVKGVKKGASTSKEDNTMKSILKLGYGPISAQTLLDKVESGQVKEVVDKNGNKTFEKTKKTSNKKTLPIRFSKYGF